MRKVTIGAVQMRCVPDAAENIEKADALVRQAAEAGAGVILLPELFERPYFCQERRYEYYHYAKPVEENDAVRHFRRVAKELEAVIPVSFYEQDNTRLYNSAAVIDADGEILGVYRKTHIPDDHFTRKNSIFHRETADSACGIPDLERLAWGSAGISGFRRRRGAWR